MKKIFQLIYTLILFLPIIAFIGFYCLMEMGEVDSTRNIGLKKYMKHYYIKRMKEIGG